MGLIVEVVVNVSVLGNFADLEVVVTFKVEDFCVEAASIVEDLLVTVSLLVVGIFDVGLIVEIVVNVSVLGNSADLEVVVTFKVEDFCVEAASIVEDLLVAVSLLVTVIFDVGLIVEVVVNVSVVGNSADLEVVVTFKVEDFCVEAASILEDLFVTVSLLVAGIFDVGLIVEVVVNVSVLGNSADLEVVVTFEVEDFCVEAASVLEDLLVIGLVGNVSVVDNSAVVDDCGLIVSLGVDVAFDARFSSSVLFKKLAIKGK